jgi:hypothetical protein
VKDHRGESAVRSEDEWLALYDENAHLAAFLDDLRKSGRAVVDAAPKSKEDLRVALIEFRDALDCLDRIEKRVGGFGPPDCARADEPRTCTVIVDSGEPCGEPLLRPDVCYDHAKVDPNDPDGGPIDPRNIPTRTQAKRLAIQMGKPVTARDGTTYGPTGEQYPEPPASSGPASDEDRAREWLAHGGLEKTVARVRSLAALLAEVRAEEREACADLCEGRPEGRSCAVVIRRRTTHPKVKP